MSYKKIVLNNFGGSEVLRVVEEAVLPEPAAHEVRVKILAASASFTDTMVRKGIYFGFKEKPPLSPGYDMVGLVDKIGSAVSGLEVGQMVADLTVWGAYTEYMLRPADSLVPVPAGIDPAEAVSMVLSYVTAFQMLHRVARVQHGQRILVHGAGGAVGTALLELGRLLDLEVIGTASMAKHDLVKVLGARPIDYKTEDFVQIGQDLGGFDAVFDAISGANFKRSFNSLKKGGILVPYGFYDQSMGRGGNVILDFMNVKLWNLLPNGKRTSFYSIENLHKKHPDWFKADLITLFDLIKAGKIKPSIEQRMPIDDARKAHELIEQAAVKGRIVLLMNNRSGGNTQNL